MIFEKLHKRYGSHVARRVQQELTTTEFGKIDLEDLPLWLETRAESAHRAYQAYVGNASANEPDGKRVAALYRHWQEAEELAYLITIAEDVSAQAHESGSGD